ncbi:MAG: SDR family NAD(P)-dependent oxidoreductase, partial [Ginsengibacter sp.]
MISKIFIMLPSFSLQDKVIAVTGGTGILGNAFNKAIAAAGGSVAIVGRNQTVAGERAAEIVANGGKAIAVIADVTKEEDLKNGLTKILDEYGKIDGLVNGAGGNMPGAVVQPDSDIFQIDTNALRQVMDLNLFGTLLPTQIFGAAIQKTGRGSIVNISSMTSQQAVTKVLGYSIAK